MRLKSVAIILSLNVFLFGLLFAGYTIQQKREKEKRWNEFKPSGIVFAKAISMPESDVRPFWEVEDSINQDGGVSDPQMQWCVDKTLQSLRIAGKNGDTRRAYVSMALVRLKKMTSPQAKMLESTIVPLLTPPQGGTALDKINALDYLCLINSSVGESYLPALLADPDKDVSERAKQYQQIRAKVHK